MRFNPHPPLLAGETQGRRAVAAQSDCSNPHPPLLAGETPPKTSPCAHTPEVSIHTHHYWRVKLCGRLPGRCAISRFNPHPPLLADETRRATAPTTRCCGFNPHPPLLAGETWRVCGAGQVHIVSIHTRHYWRVKPHRLCPARPRWQVSIHTRHYWRVKLHAAAAVVVQDGFQSTPAITGG